MRGSLGVRLMGLSLFLLLLFKIISELGLF